MTVAELRKALKNPPLPWMIFGGEEEYLKRHYLGEVRKALVDDAALAPQHLAVQGDTLGCGVDFAAVVLFHLAVHGHAAGLEDDFYLTAGADAAVAQKFIQTFHNSSVLPLPFPP